MRIQLIPHKEYSYYEIAQFFNIAPSTFKSHKFEKLEELKNYVLFTDQNDKIWVEKVIGSAYYLGTLEERRSFKRMMFNCLKNNIVNELSLARAMKKAYAADLQDYSLKELIYYIRYYITEYYGNSIAEGLKGKKEYSFYIKEAGVLKPLSAQQKIKDNMIQQWFGNLSEKVLIIQDMINNKELTKEEAWDFLEDIASLDSFDTFKVSFERAVSASVTHGCRVINREEYLIDIDDDDIEDDEYSIDVIKA